MSQQDYAMAPIAPRKRKHGNCKRVARGLIERISHDLYRLSLYGKDDCPTAGVSRYCLAHINDARETIDEIRRAMNGAE